MAHYVYTIIKNTLKILEDEYVGLASVKEKIYELVDLAGVNYDRELRGEEIYEVILQRSGF